MKEVGMCTVDERFVLRAIIQTVTFQHILKYPSLTYKHLNINILSRGAVCYWVQPLSLKRF